jgi:hypothetical protein
MRKVRGIIPVLADGVPAGPVHRGDLALEAGLSPGRAGVPPARPGY